MATITNKQARAFLKTQNIDIYLASNQSLFHLIVNNDTIEIDKMSDIIADCVETGQANQAHNKLRMQFVPKNMKPGTSDHRDDAGWFAE